MMRLFTSTAFAFLIVLGGCSTEPEQKSRDTVEESEPAVDSGESAETASTREPIISTPTPDQSESPASVPSPTPTATEAPTTATLAEASTTAAVAATTPAVAPTPEIVPQPSSYPVEMARTVELRKQLEQVEPESGALTDEQATTLERFALHMQGVAQADRQLPNDQKREMEDLAGKLQYQAENMRPGTADATFQNRLAGVKRIMESLQGSLTTQYPQSPQQ